MSGIKNIIGPRAECHHKYIRAKSFKIIIVCALLYSIIPFHTALATLYCSPSAAIDALSGQYRINANVWGSTPGEQCLEMSANSTYFSVVHSTHNSSGVAAYPFIFKGCHWGYCTQNSGFPLKISEMGATPFTWIIDTNGASGTWNCSYESWFSKAGGTAPDAAEIMVWINYAGGANPAGTKVDTVSIGGADWDVYFVDWTQNIGWYYIAYKKVIPVERVDLNFKDFVDDSMARGYLNPDWYMDNMEAGFEIWRDGEGLTSNYFFASTNDELPTVQITSPSNGSTFTEGNDITIDVNASDSDGNIIKVEFYLNSVKLGESNVAPYSYTWSSVPAGDFNLTAVVYDDYYAQTTSAVIHITVTGAGGSGRILREWWTDIEGDDVNDLTSDANYPDNPAGREVLESMEAPVNWADNYGTRIRGYLHPITTGDYTFWIAGDANSELLLSTTTDTSDAVKIAYVSGRTEPNEWEKYSEQQSSPVSLTGGEKYYIEVLHKAADENDNLSVAWQGPGLSRQIVHGLFLSPYLTSFNTTIRKATVKAGKTAGLDSIICSGTFGVTSELFDASDSITVQLYSAADNYLVYNQTISTNLFTHSTNNYNYKFKVRSNQPGSISLLQFNTYKQTFSLQTKNLDLTGLSCPMYLLIDLGTYAAFGVADENTVNGKNIIPTRLMRLYDNTLVVTKAKARHSTKPSSDSLSVRGYIAVADMNTDANEPNLVTEDVVLTWGDHNGTPTKTLTIPGNDNPLLASFKASKKGHVYKCSRIHPAEDPNSSIAAQFDLDKCTFSVSVSKADSLFTGPADPNFSLSFDTPNGVFVETVDINRITGRSY